MSEIVKLKCLSLWQPWAQAIALDLKHWETRGWTTSYRGPLGIHAAKRKFGRESFGDDFYRQVVLQFRERDFGMHCLDFGRLLCVADLVDCVPASIAYTRTGSKEHFWGDFRERGDDGRRRYAFRLTNLRVIAARKRPAITGRQGFFDAEVNPTLFVPSEPAEDSQASLSFPP